MIRYAQGEKRNLRRGSKGQCVGVKDDEQALKCDWCVKMCFKRNLKATRKR